MIDLQIPEFRLTTLQVLHYPFAWEFWKSGQTLSGGVVYTYSGYVAYRETRVTQAALPTEIASRTCYNT
jgi:hypothetical protein